MEDEMIFSIKKTEIEKWTDILDNVRPVKVCYSQNYIEMLQDTIRQYQEAIEVVYADLLNKL